MAWQTTIFERSKLYEEIWREPMTVVARRYHLSDVGLRKVCLSLDIPIPARGHWARVAAGQPVPKVALGEAAGATSYTWQTYAREPDVELEVRVAQQRVSVAKAPVLAELPPDLAPENTSLGKEAAQIARSVARSKEEGGTVTLMHRAWADVDVSPRAMQRALQLLNRIAKLVCAAGGVFHISHAPESVKVPYPSDRNRVETERGYIEFHGYRYFFRIKERVRSEEVPDLPVPASAKKAGRPMLKSSAAAFFARKNMRYLPTGKLTVLVMQVRSSYDVVRAEDTVTTVLEGKLAHLVERLEAIALETKLKAEIALENELERQRKALAWRDDKARKDGLLKQLAEFEALAGKLDRALALRRLVTMIRACPNAPDALKAQVPVIEVRADWLDPLVAKPWPEVDDVPDVSRYWY